MVSAGEAYVYVCLYRSGSNGSYFPFKKFLPSSTHAHFRQNSIPLSPKFLKTASRAIVKCVFNWMWF